MMKKWGLSELQAESILNMRLRALRRLEEIEIRAEHTGELLLQVASAPADRAGGEVLVACQAHNAAFPHDVVAEVRVARTDGTEAVTRYTLRHEFR